ncbi:hypothetical protein AWZ03_009867 [Drosophila navojoa]|uniref:CHK kinase-like domain-containing protein n=1 Tax=Drosophila navojoa TaxID=7232 RepID=A0A484B4M7_DRONA|nr:uncharacterized protein LOC115563668 [Drosophila navojoa]TDG43703.1 hypothetical protein AWZ03_009867 [Drosophila navojoa]
MPKQSSYANLKVLAAPDWLTREYVQQRMRNYLKESKLRLQKLHIQPATANGENYASVMTRIIVEYTDKDLCQHTDNFIVKTTFADKDPAAHLLEQYGVYVREMDMYEEELPKLAKIILLELGDSRKMFARTVYVDREHDSIMFEDMSLDKYSVADRLKQLDLNHVRLVLEKLAKFHAAGAVLNERQPGIYGQKYDRCFFNKYTQAYKPIMQNMLRALITSIEDDKALHKRYAAKLNGVIDHIMEYGERTMELNKGDFATLCHGDLWTTNIMFNYLNDGTPDNVIFIDFQFSVWSSPAIDLHYFFCTSVQNDLFRYHQAELVHFYYQNLVEALTKLKYKGQVPSLFEFQQQFQARGFYGVFCSLVFLAAMLHTGPEEFSIEKALSDSVADAAVRVAVYKSELYQRKLREILPILEHKGLLDEM